ncbi:MAG TPA: methyltransferase domain-containing protein [Ardenticatenaceae bacterium]|jgi:SAM-dependent methyltransferase
MSEQPKELWSTGAPYDRYVGRWSRKVATEFLGWLSVSAGKAWVDVGCGTGSLVENILGRCDPASVVGIDRSEGFLVEARRKITDTRVRFQVGDAMDLPLDAATCDVAVSGLVLNFVADHAAMVREMARVTKPGGKVAVYVWDYAGGMEMMRHFWDAALAVSPDDARLDEAGRFPICHPDALSALWQEVGLTAITVQAIDIPTVFRDFEDYWTPFLGKQGPGPTYLASVDSETQGRIREHLQTRLVPAADGTIALSARVWAVQGSVASPGS